MNEKRSDNRSRILRESEYQRSDGRYRFRYIDKVRLSDAKAWLIKLQQVDGKRYSSIHSICGVLRRAFQMAVDDGLIRKNPFGSELASVILHWEKYLEHIIEKYNKIFRIQMPKVTSHRSSI